MDGIADIIDVDIVVFRSGDSDLEAIRAVVSWNGSDGDVGGEILELGAVDQDEFQQSFGIDVKFRSDSQTELKFPLDSVGIRNRRASAIAFSSVITRLANRVVINSAGLLGGIDAVDRAAWTAASFHFQPSVRVTHWAVAKHVGAAIDWFAGWAAAAFDSDGQEAFGAQNFWALDVAAVGWLDANRAAFSFADDQLAVTFLRSHAAYERAIYDRFAISAAAFVFVMLEALRAFLNGSKLRAQSGGAMIVWHASWAASSLQQFPGAIWTWFVGGRASDVGAVADRFAIWAAGFFVEERSLLRGASDFFAVGSRVGELFGGGVRIGGLWRNARVLSARASLTAVFVQFQTIFAVNIANYRWARVCWAFSEFPSASDGSISAFEADADWSCNSSVSALGVWSSGSWLRALVCWAFYWWWWWLRVTCALVWFASASYEQLSVAAATVVRAAVQSGSFSVGTLFKSVRARIN